MHHFGAVWSPASRGEQVLEATKGAQHANPAVSCSFARRCLSVYALGFVHANETYGRPTQNRKSANSVSALRQDPDGPLVFFNQAFDRMSDPPASQMALMPPFPLADFEKKLAGHFVPQRCLEGRVGRLAEYMSRRAGASESRLWGLCPEWFGAVMGLGFQKGVAVGHTFFLRELFFSFFFLGGGSL